MPGKRVIVVTGAASGIGAAAADILRGSGDTFIGVDIKEPAAGAVDQFVAMDQSDSASIDTAISEMPDKIMPDKQCRRPARHKLTRTSITSCARCGSLALFFING